MAIVVCCLFPEFVLLLLVSFFWDPGTVLVGGSTGVSGQIGIFKNVFLNNVE